MLWQCHRYFHRIRTRFSLPFSHSHRARGRIHLHVNGGNVILTRLRLFSSADANSGVRQLIVTRCRTPAYTHTHGSACRIKTNRLVSRQAIKVKIRFRECCQRVRAFHFRRVFFSSVRALSPRICVSNSIRKFVLINHLRTK